MKKILLTTIKFAISAALIYWLVQAAQGKDPDTFRRMLSDPKRWDLLAGAFGCCFLALVITFVRWHLLVRALDLPFSLKDAFRLGFLGYFWNFFSLGSVGGDVFKAVFVAREQKSRKAEAVASVVVDRMIGLYAMFVLATLAMLATGALDSPITEVRAICRANLIATGVGAAGIVLLFLPGLTSQRMTGTLERIPKVGPTLARLWGAVGLYRRRWPALLVAGLMSLAVHGSFAVGIWLAALGIPGASPTLPEHLVIVPLALVTGVLPLPMSGLGAFEAAVDFLYVKVADPSLGVVAGQGLLVSLVYRMISIAIALVGAWYYFIARRELAQALAQGNGRSDRRDGEETAGDLTTLSQCAR